MKSWKTLASGVLSALVVIFTIVNKFISGEPVSGDEIMLAISALASAIGLIFAKDYDATGKA